MKKEHPHEKNVSSADQDQSALSRQTRAFELLPEMIFIVGGDGRIIESNRMVRDHASRAKGMNVSLNIISIVSPEMREEFLQHLGLSDADRSFRSQFSMPNSTIIDVEVTLRPMGKDHDGETMLIAKDITEQRHKEVDLLMFSEVVHHTVNPIEITDAKGKIIYVNPAFENVTGYSTDELIGKNPSILNSGKHPKDFWRSMWEAILGGKEWVGQVQNRRKSGMLFFTELVVSPIIDDQGKVIGFLGAHRDITEQKMLEEQLVRSQKMETFGTLAAGIAHEVGNPLTSISSIVQVIQRTTKDQFAVEKLELVKNQINRIAKIIRELVDFSRPSAYEIQLANVNAIIRDAMNIVQYGKKAHNFSFNLSLEDPLPSVAVVTDQLVQVFLNILMNAVDACTSGKGRIDVESRRAGDHIEVIISDNGTGITGKEIEKVFDPFFTTKEVGKGTGLGLWVSLGIMKNFGGDIRVESEFGTGSAFTVILPLKGSRDV